MGNILRHLDEEDEENQEAKTNVNNKIKKFTQSDEEWISMLKRADQLISDKARLVESCRMASMELADVYEILNGYRSRILESRDIATTRRERESLILGILKRKPEVVAVAGIENALYSMIGLDRVDVGGTAGTFEDIENAIIVFARIRLAYQRKINADTARTSSLSANNVEEKQQSTLTADDINNNNTNNNTTTTQGTTTAY